MNMNVLFRAILFVFDINIILLKAIFKWFVPKSYKSIKGEVCLITGSGRGIGRALAIEFAKRGAILILWDINVKGNEETAGMVKEIGGTAHTACVDVSKRQEVYKAAELIVKSTGSVTILVNCAGIVYGKDFFEIKDEEIINILNVNTLSHYWTCRAFLPKMMQNNHGHIVTIASTLGLISSPGVADYAASKHAVVGFHNSLTLDLVKHNKLGIKTTLVCPHLVRTEMFSGMKSPSFPPSLSLDDCVKGITEGVLSNQAYVYMPRFIYLLHNMTTWLPHEAFLRSHREFGTFDVMGNISKNRAFY